MREADLKTIAFALAGVAAGVFIKVLDVWTCNAANTYRAADLRCRQLPHCRLQQSISRGPCFLTATGGGGIVMMCCYNCRC